MNSKRTILILAAALIFQAIFFSRPLFALQLNVDQNKTNCVQLDFCFKTITEALQYVVQSNLTPTTTTYSIMVEPGTYPESITMLSGVTIEGRETARTILSGSGSETLVTANNLTGTNTISHFTFVNAGIGVLASGNSILTISNNIFNLQNGTGVQVQNAPSVKINNNTFYRNAVAISRNSDVPITNNIFSLNTSNIQQTGGLGEANLTFNDYNPGPIAGEPIGSSAIPNVLLPNQNPDPLFVNPNVSPPDMDLHLKTGSPCINSGSSSAGINTITDVLTDMGAYGGGGSDSIPGRVTGVVKSSPDSSHISINWNKNEAYEVFGYRVWYSKTSSSGTGTYQSVDASEEAIEGPSPIDVQGDLSITLSFASSATGSLGTPVMDQPRIRNESLALSWSAVPNATSYKVYYSTSPFGTPTIPFPLDTDPIDVGNTTSYILSGLTNSVPYYVAVSAVAQTTYYIAVTAYDVTSPNTAPAGFEPGVKHESAFSLEVSQPLGSSSEGVLSNVPNEYPDIVDVYPKLPNTRQGCFIATAAYGHYSSPQVQALRDFRDAYLLSSGPGKDFVEWYYAHSPTAAAWLNGHPEYKPLVRAALAPVVGISLLMTRTPFLFKVAAYALLGLFTGIMVHRRRRSSQS